MRVLVIHQNFPGQFGEIVRAWSARAGWEIRALGREIAPGLPGFEALTRYKLHRSAHSTQHPYLRQMEAATLHGQAVARAMMQLRDSGFIPDAILAHPGWGETLYAKDVFPDARLLHYCEWFYSADGADLGFDPEFPMSFDDRARIRTWNALHTLNLTHCDAAIAPTRWQRDRHPAIFLPKIEVQHEGIATDELGPDAAATVDTPTGIRLKAGDPVITFVARNLEPYRGFHVFMRALERIQASHPTCQTIIVGGDDVSYGRRPNTGANWREHMLAEVKLDPARTHFLGRVPRGQFVRILQVSAAHVYLTYPFVLSWSLLEAMACGAPIVASDTAPVREAITDESTGRLVDFFDPAALARAVIDTLADPPGSRARGERARRHVQTFSRANGLARYDELIGPAHGSPRADLRAVHRELA